MKRIAVIVTALALFPAILFAQVNRDEQDLSKSGAMSLEELGREPITFDSHPHDDTGNPRHRLDLYLRKNPKSDKLPVIVFFHGGGWMQGDKSDGAGRLMPSPARVRYAGVSVGYRLSGEVKWPGIPLTARRRSAGSGRTPRSTGSKPTTLVCGAGTRALTWP